MSSYNACNFSKHLDIVSEVLNNIQLEWMKNGRFYFSFVYRFSLFHSSAFKLSLRKQWPHLSHTSFTFIKCNVQGLIDEE